MFSKGSSKNDAEKRSLENRVEPVRSFRSGSGAAVAPSIISANLRVTGDLDSDGDIQIDGYVEGDVRSHSVTVGEHAVVSGAINSDVVNVAGTVKGQIHGKVVELTSTAKVTGDIVHESLAIEAGAFIQGLCRHVDTLGQKGAAESGAANGGESPAIESKPARSGATAAAPPQAETGEAGAKKLFG